MNEKEKKEFITEEELYEFDDLVEVLGEDFKQKYPNHKDLNEIEKFANARRTGNIKTLFKLRYLAPDIAKFDIVTALLPKKLFSFMVKIAQKIS